MLKEHIWKKIGESLFWLVNAMALSVVTVFILGSILKLGNQLSWIAALPISIMGIYWCFRCVDLAIKPFHGKYEKYLTGNKINI